MYDWVLNMLSEGFIQDVPQEELVIPPVIESLTTTVWQNYHQ